MHHTPVTYGMYMYTDIIHHTAYIIISYTSHMHVLYVAIFGNPHRTQNREFELFKLILLLKLRRTAPCRVIRGDRISVNCTLPPGT